MERGKEAVSDGREKGKGWDEGEREREWKTAKEKEELFNCKHGFSCKSEHSHSFRQAIS